MKNIVLSSNNKGKINEIQKILSEYKIQSLKDVGIDLEVIEDADTFEGNASKKAIELYNLINDENIATMSDDSGIEITKLNGWPGVYTHRIVDDNASDEDRNKLIIEKCKELKGLDREVYFVCNISYYDGKKLISKEAKLKGLICNKMRGDNGFGFDSIFEILDCEENINLGVDSKYFNKTLAELSNDEKNNVSPRNFACKMLQKELS